MIRSRYGEFVLDLRDLLRKHGARLEANRMYDGGDRFVGMEVDVFFAPMGDGELGTLDMLRVIEMLGMLDRGDEARVVRDDPWSAIAEHSGSEEALPSSVEQGEPADRVVPPSDPESNPMPISTPYLDRLCGRAARRGAELGPGVRLTYHGNATHGDGMYTVRTGVHRDAGQNLRACLRAIGVLVGEDDHLDEWSERVAREDYEHRIGPRGTGDGFLDVDLYRSY